MNMGFIYCITNIVNNKKYIGQTKDIKDRKRNHFGSLKRNKHHNAHLQSAWNKYGESNFIFEIILTCPTEDLDNEEVRIIKEMLTINNKYGYNLTSGGNTSKIISDETRKKISQVQKGRKSSEETKKKQSEGMKKHYLTHQGHGLGSIRSNETKQKMSISRKGKPLSEEAKKNIAAAKIGAKNPNFGKPLNEKSKEAFLITRNKPCSEEKKKKISNGWSEELRKKVGLARKGSNNPNYGKPMSDETKARLKEAREKYWTNKRLNS